MTIAYSNKYDIWTTRYSFEPTCYAHVGNTLLSSKDQVDGAGNGVYKHDSNPLRCNFYDVSEGCSLEVVSNQDPSAIKSFNSISLETNIKNWSAFVFSNDEYDDASKQNSEIIPGQFVTREGFQYAEIPGSLINSSRNIFPVGNSGSAAPQVEAISSEDEEDFARYRVTFPSPIAPGVPSSATDNDGVYPFRIYMLKPIGDLGDFEVADILETVESYCVGVGLKSVDIQFNSVDTSADNISTSIDTNQLVVQSSPALDGDKMRGPYARIQLSTSTDQPLELHAVNVDYSFSMLDSRLTQNS